jgi:hypothetical protein
VRKTFRSTFVAPRRLRELGYAWKYSLEEAFRDWKRECPDDFSSLGVQGKRALESKETRRMNANLSAQRGNFTSTSASKTSAMPGR